MSSIKDKIAELDYHDAKMAELDEQYKSEHEVKPLKEKEGFHIASMKYSKDKDWNNVRMNIIGMLNAFQPTVIDNSEQVKNQCIQIIEEELENAKDLYENMKDEGLTANSIESEGYIRACSTILNKIQEWV